MSRHERGLVPMSRHERETVMTTHHCNGQTCDDDSPLQQRIIVAVTGQHCDDQISCGDGSALRRPIVLRRRIFISRPNIIAPANNHYGNEIFLNLLLRYKKVPYKLVRICNGSCVKPHRRISENAVCGK